MSDTRSSLHTQQNMLKPSSLSRLHTSGARRELLTVYVRLLPGILPDTNTQSQSSGKKYTGGNENSLLSQMLSH